jgi:uncharacterized protein (UPF0332 family)
VREATRKLLEKASRAIHSAELLLSGREVEFAAGRAYYAMFYIAEALLNEKGLRSRKHAGIHGLFGEQFAKPGLLDPKFHRWLINAFDWRLQGDYAFEATIAEEEVVEMIAQAREFLDAARGFVESSP